MRVPALAVLVGLALQVQGLPRPPVPPRDVVRRADPTGSGIVRGRVIAADSGAPIRRVSVSLSPASPQDVPAGATSVGGGAQGLNAPAGRPRSTTTDQQGGFEFTGLPPGSYRLTASAPQYSAQYLSMTYGAKRPGGPGGFDPGQPIQLAAGAVFGNAVIALPRGAVIAGRVTDDNGEPLARVQVYGLFFFPGGSRAQRAGGVQTDDLGQFRLYGLQPGEYAVVAEARGNTFVPPNAPPETEEDRTGFVTTFYPGTADETAAQRVRARTGAETADIEIRMAQARLFHVTGIVTDSEGRAVARASGQLTRRSVGGASSGFGFSTDESGQFQMRNIPPGDYRLTVRGRPSNIGPNGAAGDPGEMANMPVSVAADLENLLVVTSPGATITGQIVFEQGPPAQMPSPMRVTASAGNMFDGMSMAMSPPPAVVQPDLTFTMKGLMGELLLRGSAAGEYLKSVSVGGEDVTDTPREFKTGDRVTIVLTSRASTIEGTVSDAAGKPATGAAIMMFSEDKAAWRSSSSRTRRSLVDANGRFRVSGLVAGRYYILAIPPDRLNASPLAMDGAFFEQLAKDATILVVGEDEQRVVDLRVVAAGGGPGGGQ